MDKREKIIKCLAVCSKNNVCQGCPEYVGVGHCTVDEFVEVPTVYIHEAIKLLKEQEPTYTNSLEYAPVINAFWVEEAERERHWHCSNCGKVQGIVCIAMKYCPECGAKMSKHPWATLHWAGSGCGQAFSPD